MLFEPITINMQEIELQKIIEGGAVGITVLMIIYTGWKDRLYNKTLNNHLSHFTDAIDRNTNVIEKNAEINGSINETNRNVAKVLERVEYNLNHKK